MPSVEHAVYFYFSLSFLISRATAVMLFVSSVNDRAHELLRLLRLVPHAAYHDEVSRLAAELSADNVSLSGLKFFHITRKLFLTVSDDWFVIDRLISDFWFVVMCDMQQTSGMPWTLIGSDFSYRSPAALSPTSWFSFSSMRMKNHGIATRSCHIIKLNNKIAVSQFLKLINFLQT